MNKNEVLIEAGRNKNDDFYTRYDDIENELKHYRKHFKGKTVYCNCDDPRASNFFEYFRVNFEWLGLKKLITSCYKNQNPLLFSDHNDERAVYIEYEGDKDGNSRVLRYDELEVKKFRGDGAFQNSESIELLKQADIVVTNPPFSLFRKYIKQLLDYHKKFLIMGPQNAISYKEFFPYIKDNKIWLGVNSNRTLEFEIPDHYPLKGEAKINKYGKKIAKVSGINWYTNLEHPKRMEKLTLYKIYFGNEEEYPKYDNYDAIEVSKTKYIPADWGGGYMGVPISFLNKFNPDQFEIVGIDYDVKTGLLPNLLKPNWKGKLDRGYINGRRMYARIIIRNRIVTRD